jgi:hypothetical protein
MANSRRVAHQQWTEAELAVAKHFAQAVVAGRYPTVTAAVPGCQTALAGRHTRCSITAQLHRLAHELGMLRKSSPWLMREKAVVDSFARAVVSRRYRYIKDALPDCQRELRRISPDVRRTDDAVAWVILCRAYDFGLPRRKHLFTAGEKRILERCASDLAHAEYPDIGAAVRGYKAACKRSGLGVRHTDSGIYYRIKARARALGYAGVPRPGPRELRIIARFSRAVARNSFSSGKAAASDCARALDDVGFDGRLSRASLANRINAGARELGWRYPTLWDKLDTDTVLRFEAALADGRYPTIKDASSACLESLKRSGRFRDCSTERFRSSFGRHLKATLGKLWRPCWRSGEMRILNRFAQAYAKGRYRSVSAAAAACSAALARAGLTGRQASASTVRRKMTERLHELGWRSPVIRWSAKEIRAAVRWLGWYRSQPKRGPRRSVCEAARRLKQEIEALGGARSLRGCEDRLYKDHLRVPGDSGDMGIRGT